MENEIFRPVMDKIRETRRAMIDAQKLYRAKVDKARGTQVAMGRGCSFDKVFRVVLECRSKSYAEVGRELGVHKQTVARIMAAAQNRGFSDGKGRSKPKAQRQDEAQAGRQGGSQGSVCSDGRHVEASQAEPHQ